MHCTMGTTQRLPRNQTTPPSMAKGSNCGHTGSDPSPVGSVQMPTWYTSPVRKIAAARKKLKYTPSPTGKLFVTTKLDPKNSTATAAMP